MPGSGGSRHRQLACSTAEPLSATPQIAGVVVVFDSADGGIIGSTLSGVQQLANGALSQDNSWKQCYLDPPDAFQTLPKR
jgi:hypothetical protein